MAKQIIDLLREARITLEMWKDVAPAVSLCADIDAALLVAAPAPIQQGQLVEVGQMIEFDDHEDPRFHTIICDWDNEARAKLTAGTKIYAVSAGSQVQAVGMVQWKAPRSAEELITFIGSNFASMDVEGPVDDRMIRLSFHDLRSAFDTAGAYDEGYGCACDPMNKAATTREQP